MTIKYSILIILSLLSCNSIITVDKLHVNKNIQLNNTENTMDSINTYYQRKYDPKTGLEVYDFETVQKSKTKPNTVVKTFDGCVIVIGNMLKSGAFYNEYLSKPFLAIVQKQFYPSGKLKQKGSFYPGIKIGLWQYYDENGNLIKEVDEDEKYRKSKIKINGIIDLLEKEGCIDQKTGKGATKVIVDNTDVIIYQSPITIAFAIDEKKEAIWTVTDGRGREYTLYQINGNTGEITKTIEEINVIK